MIPAGRAHLHITAVTHPGLQGKSNEDRYAVSAHRLSKRDHTPSLLAIVADGVGGNRAGEVAAEMAVETISQLVAQSDAAQPVQTLARAMSHASQLIYEQSQRDLAQIGMATTAVCAWIIGDRLYTAAAGDSRLYLLRGGRLQCLTTDHTWVQAALEYGALSPEQARDHPNAHVIQRYLGSKHPLRPDLRLRLFADESNTQAEANQGLRLKPGDRLLLCSDGLTDLVEDAEILAALSAGNGREEALQGLVELANERGGHDNITMLMLEMPPGQAGKAASRPTRRLPISVLAGGLMAAIILLLVAGLGWFLLRSGGLWGPTLTPNVPPMTSIPSGGTLPVATPVAPSAIPALPASPVQPNVSPTSLPAATYTPWPTNTLGP